GDLRVADRVPTLVTHGKYDLIRELLVRLNRLLIAAEERDAADRDAVGQVEGDLRVGPVETQFDFHRARCLSHADASCEPAAFVGNAGGLFQRGGASRDLPGTFRVRYSSTTTIVGGGCQSNGSERAASHGLIVASDDFKSRGAAGCDV